MRIMSANNYPKPPNPKYGKQKSHTKILNLQFCHSSICTLIAQCVLTLSFSSKGILRKNK